MTPNYNLAAKLYVDDPDFRRIVIWLRGCEEPPKNNMSSCHDIQDELRKGGNRVNEDRIRVLWRLIEESGLGSIFGRRRTQSVTWIDTPKKIWSGIQDYLKNHPQFKTLTFSIDGSTIPIAIPTTFDRDDWFALAKQIRQEAMKQPKREVDRDTRPELANSPRLPMNGEL